MKRSLLFLITVLFLSQSIQAQTLYVDSAAAIGGNGGSWSMAFTELSDALDSAWHNPAIDEIHVASGTYHPVHKPYEMNALRIGVENANIYNRQRAFHIRTGLKVLGGFPTGGGAQNILLNKSILDGVLSSGDSSFHVVYIDSSDFWAQMNDTTMLGGFTIQNGNNSFSPANHLAPIANGQGYGLQHGGGGILISGGTVYLQNNELRNNVLGAICIQDSSSVILRDNYIQNNVGYNSDTSDRSKSAGLFTSRSSLWILNNTISHNYNTISQNNGSNQTGGIFAEFGSELNIIGNRISNNTGFMTGGIFAGAYSTIIENNIIDSNQGAVSALKSGGALVKNNFIYANTGLGSYGHATEIGSSAVFTNNVLLRNQVNYGGAILVWYADSAVICNNTIAENTQLGVRICCGDAYFYNNIFYNNGDDFQWNSSVDTNIHVFKNNLFQDDSLQYTVSNFKPLDSLDTDNLYNLNPLFVDINDPLGPDNIFGTADDGLRLLGNSPCIDSGNNGLLPASLVADVTGAPRVQNGIVNMGAYESLAWPTAIEEIEIETLSVYPNPVLEELNIEAITSGEIIVTDILGNTIVQREVVKENIKLNVSQFARGAYFLLLKGNGKSWSTKFIKK